MNDLKRMLSSIIRDNGNYVSRDKAAECLREFTDMEKERDAWKKIAKDWMNDHDKLKAKYEPDELVAQ